MQYASLALSLAWPQIVVALLWLGAALVALWYARATRRPIFLFGGITALMISLSEVLSPLRLAYRYFTHKEYCSSQAACTVELQFGAAKFEWMLVGLAAFVLCAGFYLEIARARRRAAANNAARAAAQKAALSVSPTGGPVSGSVYAGLYQAPAQEPSVADYEAARPADMAGAVVPPEELPPFSGWPPAGSSSGPF